MRPPPDKAEILRSLAAVARAARHPPSRSEFVSRSGISEYYVSKFFPSWNAAVRAAGLEPYALNLRLGDRTLLEDWGRIVRRIRKLPARRAYRRLGKYDPRTIERRFGPWSNLPEIFRIFAQGKPGWADVLALLPSTGTINRAPLEAGASPSSPQGSTGGTQACPVYPELRREEQSRVPKPAANKIQSEARAPTQPSSPLFPPNKLRCAPLQGRPTYGNPLDFRGLRHEPVNEQGVVLLFGIVAKELGYMVEAVQSGFPDCEAKRQIGPERWQRVHIEFEFESRNFRDHGHPHTGCDVIVCWRHNWPDHPRHIEILELSTAIKPLSNSDM